MLGMVCTPLSCRQLACPRSQSSLVVAVHGHPLRAPAHLAVGRRADWPAAVPLCAALLQGQELLGAERLVVDLRRGLDEILEVSPEQEVPEVDKLAVVLILDIDDAPPVMAAADLLAVDDDRLLGSDDGKGNEVLMMLLAYVVIYHLLHAVTYPDLAVDVHLLLVKLVVVVGVHLEVVESKLLLDARLELLALLEGERVGLGDNRDNVHDVRELLQHHDVDRLKRVTRGLDKEQAAVNARVLDVALSLGGELLAEVGRVLVLDVLHDRVPAPVVVDQVAVPGGVDNVQPETHAVLLNDVRYGMDLSRGSDDFLGV